MAAIAKMKGSCMAARTHGNDAVVNLRDNSVAKLAVDKLTTNTSTVIETERVQVDSSGTAAAGLGARKSWWARNASGNAAELARMDVVLVTATDAAEDGRVDFSVNVAGTMTRVFRVGTTGPVFDVASTLDFSAGAATFSLKDATAAALAIKQGSNVYMNFDTSDNAEIITIGPDAAIGTAAFLVKLQGRVTTTDGVTSGTARVVGGLAYSNTAASAAVTSTSTETLFDKNYTVPADTLKAGSVVKIHFQGIATGTANTDTLTVKLYIGGLAGTALLASSATDAANNDIFSGDYTLVCRTAGTSGTFVGDGSFTKVEGVSGTATDVKAITASTAINTTTTQVIGVGAKWSTADTVDTCRLDILTVEIY